ncbi:DNA cytosine methyltransferase [Salinispora arenicola]|uniref:DNA cytosine methyltransferase n=1 Tax=Salinispora arenicola TaxID=168697 RepID=UPI00035E3198|nr:DNA cytosine methyltransferase [Salinispora arenicola]
MVQYGVKLQRSDDLRLDDHPESCTEETFAKWCAARMAAGQRLAVDLFSGAGGLSLGLEEAGWTVAASVDNDPKSLQTHRHNFPGLALACDLSDELERGRLIKLLSSTEIDLVAGGPPCQPFSRAGRSKIRSLVESGHRPEHDHRRELWRSFLDIAIKLNPRAVLMENVPDMALGDSFQAIREMVDQLERCGYHTQINLVDAWHYGVPQHRKRLILLARRDADVFAWFNPQPEPTTLADAIKDLPPLDVEHNDIGGRERIYHKPHSLSPFAQRMREGMNEPVVWDHMTRPVRDDDREIFTLMHPQMLYIDIPDHLRRYTADTFDDKYKKLGWNDLSRSITAHIAKDGYWYIHPEQPRTLTVREAARVQTFPDRFRFAGTRSDAFRQIGNAVPPLLGKAAAIALAPGVACTGMASSARWGDAREALSTWARRQQHTTRWYLLPGPRMTKPVAALVALLFGHATPPQILDAIVAKIQGKDRLTKRDLASIAPYLNTGAGRRSLDKLALLVGARRVWAHPGDLASALKLKPAQQQMLQVLCEQDVLLSNQGVVRVAARFAGTKSHRTNRLTNGRIDIARLIGHGRDAPLRSAALRLIGASICRETGPACDMCPLRAHCEWHIRALAEANTNQPSLLAEIPEPDPARDDLELTTEAS